MTAPHLFADPTCLHAGTRPSDMSPLGRHAINIAGFLTRIGDRLKPWGLEFKIDSTQVREFLDRYFDGVDVPAELHATPSGPKILLIREGHRLSWHVHARKEALLRVLHGRVGVSLSPTDEEPRAHLQLPPATVHIPPGIRHRLSSTHGWAVVAEIGRNVSPDHPSDDDDTRRISDDYGR